MVQRVPASLGKTKDSLLGCEGGLFEEALETVAYGLQLVPPLAPFFLRPFLHVLLENLSTQEEAKLRRTDKDIKYSNGHESYEWLVTLRCPTVKIAPKSYRFPLLGSKHQITRIEYNFVKLFFPR